MTDYSELKRLAEEATPGPWKAQHPNAGQRGSEVADASGLNQICADLGPTHALYIAAANPAAVLSLIADLVSRDQTIRLLNSSAEEVERILDGVIVERDQLKAENERLQQFEAAYTEWSDKTDWVQETVQGYELGMHRADVLHKRCRDGAFHQQAQADRIKTLMAEVETLESQVKALQSDANSYQSGYDAGRKAGTVHADNWRAEAQKLRKERDKLAEDNRGLLEDFGGLL